MPPSGTHHYRFTGYAECRRLPLPDGAPLRTAPRAILANAFATGRLTGLFKRLANRGPVPIGSGRPLTGRALLE